MNSRILLFISTVVLTTLNGRLLAQCSIPWTYVTDSICIGDSVFVGGDYRKETGFYLDTLVGANACDSLIETYLDVQGFRPGNSGGLIYDGSFESWFVDSVACNNNDSFGFKYPYYGWAISDDFNLFSSSITCSYQPLVLPSADAVSGNTAAQIRYDTASYYTNNDGTLILFGESSPNAVELRGYFKKTGTATDTLTISFFADTTLLGSNIASGSVYFTGSQSTYIPFSVPLTYNTSISANALSVGITCNGSSNFSAWIDDLQVVTVDGINDQAVCQGDSILFNGNYYSSAGTYTDTFPTVSGCDSIVEMRLTVDSAITVSNSLSICSGDSILINGSYQSSAGIYVDSSTSVKTGCDSITSINLSVIPASTSSSSATACNSYTSPSGRYTWTSSGIYNDTLTGSNTCDSIVSINLTIITVDTSVARLGNTLTAANGAGLTYQWIDCNTSSPIAGATNMSYTASASGSYAVVVSNGSCSDTSSCYLIDIPTGIRNWKRDDLLVYPNPFKETLSLQFGDIERTEARVKLLNAQGQIVFSNQVNTEGTIEMNVENLPNGVYMLVLVNEENFIHKKVIKE